MTRFSFPLASALALVLTSSLVSNVHAASLEEIEEGGLENACYVDMDHYVAEFLYQNPDVCFWSVDGEQVNPEPTPIPLNAVLLPLPSGGNDTATLERVINGNPGGAVIGLGTYMVRDLDITVPIDIFDMAMVPVSGASRMVNILSPDVRIFNSPIDAQNMSSVYQGFHARDGSHRFTLVNSAVRNIFHRNNRNAAGVVLNGVDDFHLACNDFSNIINTTSRANTTARANAIWMNGRNQQSTSGGVIANNTASEFQSNGQLWDAEFFTVQSYVSTDVDRPIKIFGNRAVDAGKRFTKHQEGNAVVLSNWHEWTVKQGPLGRRALLSHVEVHSSDNVTARNNRVKIAADSRFDYVFFTKQRLNRPQDNLHYDCNDIEIVDNLLPGSRSTPRVISARGKNGSFGSSNFVATNSSARNNVIRGTGNLKHYYSFGYGYPRTGGMFDISENRFEVPYTTSEFR